MVISRRQSEKSAWSSPGGEKQTHYAVRSPVLVADAGDLTRLGATPLVGGRMAQEFQDEIKSWTKKQTGSPALAPAIRTRGTGVEGAGKMIRVPLSDRFEHFRVMQG